MLEIRDLKARAEDREILKGITLAVKPGEVHAIMGPNGSGKSTLARVLAGHPAYEVTGGTVTFNGKDLLDQDPEERACEGVFMAFQYPVEIPGVNNSYFLKAALNAQRKYRGEQELDAMEFLELVEDRLKVLFPPNYNVTLAEKVIPAADLSEQISLAGKEASGTGNMKFALNGAMTIGTDDGANIEIRELVGDENFFLFGLLEPEVEALYAKGYVPSSFYESDPSLKRAIDLIAQGAFSGGDRDMFAPVVSNLLYEDRFMALADYRAYIDAQAEVDAAYADTDGWTKSAILNVARSGFFSSDRSMRHYIDRIWHTPPSF